MDDDELTLLEADLRLLDKDVTFHRYPGTSHWFFESDQPAYDGGRRPGLGSHLFFDHLTSRFSAPGSQQPRSIAAMTAAGGSGDSLASASWSRARSARSSRRRRTHDVDVAGQAAPAAHHGLQAERAEVEQRQGVDRQVRRVALITRVAGRDQGQVAVGARLGRARGPAATHASNARSSSSRSRAESPCAARSMHTVSPRS